MTWVLALPQPAPEGRPDPGLAGWVRAAQRGDRAAFSELYERFGRLVHGILLARVPYSEAEDLAQDVFIHAMRQIGALREPEAFGAWLAAIARNRANDFHRRSRETVEWTGDEPDPQGHGSSNRRARDEALEALAAIRELPEAYRETLILRLVEGLTGPEIAERTGLTHGSVRVNLSRGMEMLRERMNVERRRP